MKLSDKALRLIGRCVLGSMENSTPKEDSESSDSGKMAIRVSRTGLNLRARIKPPKALILQFRKRNLDP